VVRGSNEEKGADLREVVDAELSPEAVSSHGRREDGRVGVVRKRKTNRAPARLMRRAEEARRQQENGRTQQEWTRLTRMREECEAAEERACKRQSCRPGGKSPRGLIGQVAAANVDRSRAVEERIARKQVAQEAVTEEVGAEGVTEVGETAGVAVDHAGRGIDGLDGPWRSRE